MSFVTLSIEGITLSACLRFSFDKGLKIIRDTNNTLSELLIQHLKFGSGQSHLNISC